MVNEGHSDWRGGQMITGGRLGETLYLLLCCSDAITPAQGSQCGVNRTIATARLRVMLLKMYTDYCSPAFLYYLVWVFFYLHTSSWGFTISRPHPKTPQILLQERLIHYRYTLIQIQRNSLMAHVPHITKSLFTTWMVPVSDEHSVRDEIYWLTGKARLEGYQEKWVPILETSSS